MPGRWCKFSDPVLTYPAEHGAKLSIQGAGVVAKALVLCNALLKSLLYVDIDHALFAIDQFNLSRHSDLRCGGRAR